MTRPTIPASVIAQRGRPVSFIDGTKATLVCTFSSLMRIEEDFGSIATALAETQRGMTGPAFTSVASIMAACLQHEPARDGQSLADPETLRLLLDPMLFDDYSEAAGEAISAAFPAEADDKAGEGDPDPQPGSLGESGGTSPA
jgi:hypothetical protein